MGTAESLVAAYRNIPKLEPEAVRGFGVGCHVVSDAYYLLAGITASGLSVEWFRNEFGGVEQGAADSRGVNIYDVLVEAARQSPVGARGLVFIPHMRGAGPPDPDPYSRGAFVGIRDYHERKISSELSWKDLPLNLPSPYGSLKMFWGRQSTRSRLLVGEPRISSGWRSRVLS